MNQIFKLDDDMIYSNSPTCWNSFFNGITHHVCTTSQVSDNPLEYVACKILILT